MDNGVMVGEINFAIDDIKINEKYPTISFYSEDMKGSFHICQLGSKSVVKLLESALEEYYKADKI